jgi:hypothetical protein
MQIFVVLLLIIYGGGSFYAGSWYGRHEEQKVKDELNKIKAEIKDKL